MLENFSEKYVSNETARRVLRSSYNRRVARRKPLSAINRKKRLDFAKKYISKTFEFIMSFFVTKVSITFGGQIIIQKYENRTKNSIQKIFKQV